MKTEQKRDSTGNPELDEILSKLSFAEENLVRASREQPELFMKASRYRVSCMRKLLQAEAEHDQIVASVSGLLRQKSRRRDEKTTEVSLKEQVTVNPQVIEARQAVDKASVKDEFSKLLVEAFRQRKDVCKILAEILWSEANAEIRTSRMKQEGAYLKKLRRDVEARFPGRGDDET